MKGKILEYIIYDNLHYQSSSVTMMSQITKKFNISKYSSRKYILELIQDGLIEMEIVPGGWTEDGPYPPIKGYKITEKIKKTEIYSIIKSKELNIFSRF